MRSCRGRTTPTTGERGGGGYRGGIGVRVGLIESVSMSAGGKGKDVLCQTEEC